MHALYKLRTHFVKRKRLRERVNSYLADAYYNDEPIMEQSRVTYLDQGHGGDGSYLFFEGIEPVTLFNGPDL